MYSRSRMLRALWPYLLVNLAIIVVAAFGYDSGAISVPGAYGLLFVVCLISAIVVTRWESRRPG
jgi:hypothetical protein